MRDALQMNCKPCTLSATMMMSLSDYIELYVSGGDLDGLRYLCVGTAGVVGR
jgi:hypothetical protein